MNDVEKEKTLVQDLMDLRAKLDIILEESFSRNELFSTALKVFFFKNKKIRIQINQID